MPRLTNNDFLMRHRFLKRLWEDESLQSLYGMLLPQEQWGVHQYYQMINTGSDADIIETRTTVNLGDESLPQTAGRAYAKLLSAFQQITATAGHYVTDPEGALPLIEEVSAEYRRLRIGSPAVTTQKPGARLHRIQAIARAKIDVQRHAEVLLLLVQHIMNEERALEGKPPLNFPIYRKR
ncbi:MAG: hypothetical protein ACTH30_15315 [Leucobacter sp.]